MGESKIDCSVIITTYNSPDYLRLVLLSLIDQDMDGFEVIVADDGSSNGTKKGWLRMKTVKFDQQELELVRDVLGEAKSVSEQLKTQVPESQRTIFKKQVKDLTKVLKKLK